jgi:hypothetical protein
MAPYFLWQQPKPPLAYRHTVMRKFYENELAEYTAGRRPRGFFRQLKRKIDLCWIVYLGPALTIPLFCSFCVLHDRRMRVVLLTIALFLLTLLPETWIFPHYFAPATALLFLILVQSMRHLASWQWRERPLGIAIVRAIPMVMVAFIALRVTAIAIHCPIEQPWPHGNLQRAQIVRHLEQLPNLHLIIVRYAPQHNPDVEWVYNAADIDSSKVVWARDMGEQANEELLNYFHERRVWLLEPDRSPVRLEPYRP